MNGKDLTRGSILGNIMSFSLPYMLAYFLQILYGLADLYVIGQYCDVDSTTAVSNGAQVMYMVTVVLIGLAMGTTVLTARAVGAKDNERARSIVGNTITMFAVIAAVLMMVLLSLRGWIVGVMDTPAEAVAGMKNYLTVCFTGIPFIIAYNIIASIFRGLGDSRSPMYFVAVACVINIALDYLFIGFFGLGAMGAALGTTLSQMTSVLFAITSIRRHRGVMDISRSDLQPRKDVIKNILKIGVPIAMQDGFIQISFLAITVIANQRGLIDAAAVGIVEKFIGLVFIVPSAMLSTVSAISAHRSWKYGTCPTNHAYCHDDNHLLWCGVRSRTAIHPTIGSRNIYRQSPSVGTGFRLSPWLRMGLHIRRYALLLQWFLYGLRFLHHIIHPQQHFDSLRTHSTRLAFVKSLPRYALSDGIEHLYGFRVVMLNMRRGILVDEEENE